MHLLAFLGIKVIPVLGKRDISAISSTVMLSIKINRLSRDWRTEYLQRNTGLTEMGASSIMNKRLECYDGYQLHRCYVDTHRTQEKETSVVWTGLGPFHFFLWALIAYPVLLGKGASVAFDRENIMTERSAGIAGSMSRSPCVLNELGCQKC